MLNHTPTIFIIDDDASARVGLERLIKANGHEVESFSHATAFLEKDLTDLYGCIVLDNKMPGMTGPELQQELIKKDCRLPVIFISAFGDVPTTASTMKHGAVDFLTKPVDQEDLLQAIQSAIAQDLVRVETNREVNQLKLLLESLTRREHQVMTYVITGLLNKQIAWELGITEDTVKIHRHRVMKKLKIESVAELVRFCAKAGVEPVQIQDAEL